MPLKLNIGLSKKVGESNYGSRGASVNVEVEVESALANDPDKLKERIRRVFSLVRDSVAEELNGVGNGATQKNQPPTNGNGVGTNKDHGQKPRPATQSQVRAIAAIAKRLQINLDELLNRFQVRRAQDLSIREASQLIDELKSSQQGGGNGNGRNAN